MRRTSRQTGAPGSRWALVATYAASLGSLVIVLGATAWLSLQVVPGATPSRPVSAMVHVPGGPLEVASLDGPVTVRIRSLEVAPGEVTVAAYLACVVDGACDRPATLSGAVGECNSDHPDRLDQPMSCVSVKEAIDFCEWSKARLPTSNEWRYLARGSSGAEEAGVRDLGGGVAEWACEVEPAQEELDDVVCWSFAKMGEEAGAEPARDRDGDRDDEDAGAGAGAASRSRREPFRWRDGHRSAGTGFRCVR